MADITVFKPASLTVQVVDGVPPVDQSAQVAMLQAQVASLQAQVASLQSQVATLNAKIAAAQAALA
jgi:uncharacterized protein YlxW (UPF0749 family)